MFLFDSDCGRDGAPWGMIFGCFLFVALVGGGAFWSGELAAKQAETDLPIPPGVLLWSEQIGPVTYKMVTVASSFDQNLHRVGGKIEDLPVKILVDVPDPENYAVVGSDLWSTANGVEARLTEQCSPPLIVTWQGKSRRWNIWPQVVATELVERQKPILEGR